MHDFSFIADGHVFATQKILIVQGQRNRFITANIGRPAAGARSPPTNRPVPTRGTGGEAAGGAAARQGGGGGGRPEGRGEPEATAESSAAESTRRGGGRSQASPDPALGADRRRRRPAWARARCFTLWGRKDNNNLSACSPNCADATLSHIKRVYQGGDIAIGVGVAALAAAYWSYAFSRSSTGESKGSETALRLDVAPTTSGGFAAVSGRF